MKNKKRYYWEVVVIALVIVSVGWCSYQKGYNDGSNDTCEWLIMKLK